MSDSTVPGDRLRDIRRRRGFTQEALAERAGLSLATVKKIEQGGTARIETYHTLARALGVRTSVLFQPLAPHARRRAHTPQERQERVDLLPFRQAICPPVGVAGRLSAPGAWEDQEPDLARLRATAKHLDACYHSNRYGTVAELLPSLIQSSHLAVDAYDTGAQQAEALRLRSDALQQAGRYLTQVRAYDLAHMALRDAVRDAMDIGDRLSAGAAVSIQGWLLIRQGRLDEAERIALATAEAIEPRMSRASRDELGVWGRLVIKASSAAARNNRPSEAQEMLRLARTAGAVLGDEGGGQDFKSGRFNASLVTCHEIENHMVAHRPDQVLALAEHFSVERAPTSNTRDRHLLDLVKAHVMLRHDAEATAILADLAARVPDWLRHQQMAAEAFEDVLAKQKRKLTEQQRKLAAFFDTATKGCVP